MAFVLLHIRYRDHDGCPLMVLSSNSNHFQPEHTEATARTYITACSQNSDEPYFVVFFGPDHLPRDAYAVRRGQWRNLDLRKTEPLTIALKAVNLQGEPPSLSPYTVMRW